MRRREGSHVIDNQAARGWTLPDVGKVDSPDNSRQTLVLARSQRVRKDVALLDLSSMMI
jgi:hypothetical protein